MRKALRRTLLGAVLTMAPLSAQAGAVSTAGEAAVKGLGTAPPSVRVVAAPFRGDVAGARGEELATQVAAWLAGRLGTRAQAHPTPLPLAQARAAARRETALVHVQVTLAKGELRVTADLYPTPPTAWDRARGLSPPPTGHGFGVAPVDAEVRSFLPPVMLEQARVKRVRHGEGDVLAVACGDVDGDGGLDLVLVSRARVAVGTVKGASFVAARTLPWASLAPLAPVPLREPLAGAVASAEGGAAGLWVGTTDRGAVHLDDRLRVTRAARGLPVSSLATLDRDGQGAVGLCAAVTPEALAFEGPLSPCGVPDGSREAGHDVRAEAPAPRYDGVALTRLVDRAGKAATVVAAREPSGKLRVRVGDGEVKTLDDVGAQVAVADLDQDGVLEVVTTASTGDDILVITSLGPQGPSTRLKVPAAAGVRALAVCPPEDRAVPALVAVVGNEVWLVR